MAEGIWGRQTGFPSARELSIALAGRAEDVCRHYLPGGRKERRYWRCGDVTGAPGGSLWVHLAGPRVGKWVDAATQERGDLLDLIRISRNHPTLRSAMEEAREWIGGTAAAPVRAPEPAGQERPAADPARLERFLRSARPVRPDNAGGRYLVSRGLDVADAVGLRYHPSAYLRLNDDELGRMPAILAPIRGLDGRLEAVHRIFITETGDKAPIGRPKRNNGSPLQGTVWFGPRDAARVALFEGIEDALAVRRVLNADEKARIACVATAGAGRVNVAFPSSVREIFYVQDRDQAGQRAWEALRRIHEDSGIELARILPPDGIKDPNQELQERGSDSLRETLAPLTARLMVAPAQQVGRDPIELPDWWFVEAWEEIAAEFERLVGEGVDLRLEDDLGKDVRGRYQYGIVEIALNEADIMRGAMRHEVIHALREMGAFSDGEWEVLRRKALDEWLDDPELDIRARYADRSPEEQIEEAVAEAFRRWKAGLPTDTAVSRLFDRIEKLVQAVRNVLGRRQIATWEDIFHDIERGNRRGEVRTGGTQRAAEARRPLKRGGRKKKKRWPGPSPAEIERRRAQRFLDDPRPDLSEKAPVPIVDVSELKAPPRRGSESVSRWADDNLKGVVRNADTGLLIAIGHDAVGKARSDALTPFGRAFLPAIPELLRTAVRIESTLDNRRRTGVFGYHSLLGAVRIGGQIQRVLLHVRHTKDGCLSWGFAPVERGGPDLRLMRPERGIRPAIAARPTVEIAELIRTVKYADVTFVSLTQPRETREMRAPAVEARATSTPGAHEYDCFLADWRKFEAETKQAGFHPFYAPGYDRMQGRMAELAGRTDLPEHASQVLAKTLEVTGRLSERRRRVEGFLAAAKRNWKHRQELARESRAADIFLVQTAGYPEWRDDAERLRADGTAILADPDLALHLDGIALGRGRVKWAVDQIDRYRAGDGEALAAAEARAEAARTEPDWSWETARKTMRFEQRAPHPQENEGISLGL